MQRAKCALLLSRGEKYTIKDQASPTRNQNKYKIGGEVTIKYNPQKPEQFGTGAKVSTYMISMVFLAIGITFIVCCFL